MKAIKGTKIWKGSHQGNKSSQRIKHTCCPHCFGLLSAPRTYQGNTGQSTAVLTDGPFVNLSLVKEHKLTFLFIKKSQVALAGVAQWIEHRPVNREAAGLIPSQGTLLGCGPGPLLGLCERQPIDVSLTQGCFSPSLSPSLPLSLKVNK